MAKTLIIGAGISGLTAAFRLRQQGQDVTVLEQSGKTGGVIASDRIDGRIFEQGPNTIMSKSPAVFELIQQLELESEMLEADSGAKHRYIVRNGELIALPMNPLALIGSKLFSGAGKRRLLQEPFIGRGPAGESLADFVRRRLGREFLDYAINPFVGGVYAGRPEELSVEYGFPKLFALEQRYGGLIKGSLLGMSERKKAASSHPLSGKMFSFKGGMQTLTDRLQKKLGGAIEMGCTVNHIAHNQGSYTVRCTDQREFQCDNFILTMPAPVTTALLTQLTTRPQLLLDQIRYAPIAVIGLVYPRDHVAHPLDGFGALVPEKENRHSLGIMFRSSLFPSHCSRGDILIQVYLGGTRQPELAALPEAELVGLAHFEAQSLLGAMGGPSHTWIKRWPKAIPQYDLNYGKVLGHVKAIEAEFSGLKIMGNFCRGISVPACIEAGMAL